MPKIRKPELSIYAKKKLNNLNSDTIWYFILSTFLFTVVVMVLFVLLDEFLIPIPNNVFLFGFTISVFGLVISGWFLLFQPWIQRAKNKILTNNALDYEQSQGIITLLQKMENVSVADFPVLEEELVPEQAWRPYRIEHFVAESGRSSYSGTFSGVGLFSFSGTSKGNSIGKSVPNILESSSIVFLTDGEQTLRVLIPSPEAMKELITRHLEACVEDKPDGTFVKGMVQRYAFNDAKLRMGLTNPSAIDKLDVSLESPMDARPTVRVCGQLLQPGVVLGTQLQISDKKMLLLPSGFLREFSETTQGLLETKKAPILLPEAIGA